MKTSNKILVGALAAYLLFTIVNTTGYVREYNTVKDIAATLLTKLEQIPIHTLVTTGDRSFTVTNSDYTTIGFWEPVDTNGIRISNDTLYLADPEGYINLPHLKTHLRNGVPIPVDEGRNKRL